MDKRSQILIAAEELFAEKGFEGTSVRDIAHLAGVNLAMISYYFGSKDKLFEALVEFRSGYVTATLEELASDENLSPMDKVFKLIDFYVEKIFSHHRYHNIITRHFSTVLSPELKESIMQMKKKSLDHIRKILEDGISQHMFRTVDVDMTVGTIFGTISQVTLSKEFYCRIFNMWPTDAKEYPEELATRLKIHLKDLISAHLAIPKG
jgi:AcrR family transcriptional regulator